VPRLRTKFGERAFSFSGPSAWNALPADIRDEICTATFKKKLKTFYFSLAFDCIWHRFYVTIVMHLRSYSSGGTTKFLTWTSNFIVLSLLSDAYLPHYCNQGSVFSSFTVDDLSSLMHSCPSARFDVVFYHFQGDHSRGKVRECQSSEEKVADDGKVSENCSQLPACS